MRMQDAVMSLLLKEPFYGSLASAISMQPSEKAQKLNMTLLPSPVLRYNPTWFESLPDSMAIGALVHELLHLVLLHALRRGDRDPLLWAACCDMAVNDQLPPALLSPDAVTTEKIEKEYRLKLERNRSAEHYYEALDKLDDSLSFFTREGEALLRTSGRAELQATLLSEEEASQMNERALKSMLGELIDAAHRGGELPQVIESELEPLYEKPQIDWKIIFKRFLTGRGRMQSRATYKRESRRYDGYPGSKRSVGLKVLIALDESGSITNEQLQTFLSELIEINRITNAEIMVTEFDTECSRPQPVAEYRVGKKREKNGGTDFRPVFTLADSLRVPLLVIFTDGDGTAPDRANQKVLWVLTKGGKLPADYGYGVFFE